MTMLVADYLVCDCGKRGFRTRDEAQMVVLNAKIRRALRGDQRRREQRVYLCRLSGLWHTTSEEKRQFEGKWRAPCVRKGDPLGSGRRHQSPAALHLAPVQD